MSFHIQYLFFFIDNLKGMSMEAYNLFIHYQ